MSTAEPADRVRELEGVCESQRLELQDARAALRRWVAGPGPAGSRGKSPDHVAPGERISPSNGTPPGTGNAMSDYAAEHLAALDDLLRGLQTATAAYSGRTLDWGDIACLRRVRDELSTAIKNFIDAATSAELNRAARQVAVDLRPDIRPPRLSNHLVG